MTFINNDFPPTKAWLRKEFLYNQESGHCDLVEVIIFGVTGIPGRVPMFHCVSSFGAVWFRLPIHAFVLSPAAKPELSLEDLCLWNSFSYSLSVHTFSYLDGLACAYLGRDKAWHKGTYYTTVDWCNNAGEFGFAETPDEHKCHHVIKLDNGQIALQPNNRIRWFEPAFITESFPDRPDFKVNTQVWTVENTAKWRTENNNSYMYGVIESD